MIYLDMKYKGDRNYLQGGDFFDEISLKLTSILENGYLKKLCFKSFSKNQCALVINVRPDSDLKKIGNGVWLGSDEVETRFWIVETQKVTNERYSFDEDELISSSVVTDESITMDIKNDFSSIANVVALTKKLNYTLSPNVEGKWAFGQIDLLDQLPIKSNVIKVERLSEKKNKFSCNRVLIDGHHFGDIRFIVGII